MQPGPAPRHFSPPPQVEEYRIVRWLGGGAAGEVYLAHDTLLDRAVAIKFLVALKTKSVRRDFQVEARAAARVQHPNIPSIYRIGEVGGLPYIVSEFVRGQSLEEVAKPVPWERALELGLGLCRGLAAAHRKGVLHRDIKPGNAIVGEDGEVKLVDFGLAVIVPTAGSHNPFHGHADDMGHAELPSVKRSIPPKTAMPTPTHDEPEGTPYYMAPETWRGAASRRSDVYSLGALLYELCTGRPPLHHVPLGDLPNYVQTQLPAPLLSVAPRVSPAFAALVDRCLRPQPSERFGSADELRSGLEALRPVSQPEILTNSNPYRGLGAFEAEHRALFFGRSQEIGTVAELLRPEPFVVVAGDSGVGKSSLCRAGVLPLIEQGGLGGDRDWRAITFVPGRRPMAALAAALGPALGKTEQEVLDHALVDKNLSTTVRNAYSAGPSPGRSGSQGLVSMPTLGRVSGSGPRPGTGTGDSTDAERKTGLLIFVDQLEELLTLAEPEEMKTFCDVLEELSRPSLSIRILATARGDFLTRLAALPHIGEVISLSHYILRPLSEDGLREAIVGPALAVGYTFESESLVEVLVTSTLSENGGLPLLQFSLSELWEARNRTARVIPASALDKIGGVEGALARHADGVLHQMLPGPRRIAQEILVGLVTSDDTRARKTQSELAARGPDATAALEALVRGRLLVASDASSRAAEGRREDPHDGEHDTAYEVAHEALITGWGTLRAWLDDSVHVRAARDRVGAAAAEWERLGRAPDALWGVRQMKDIVNIDLGPLSERDAAFVRESKRTIDRERLRLRLLVICIPLVIIGIVAAVKIRTQKEVAQAIARHVAAAEKLRADAKQKNQVVEQLRKASFNLFDTYKSEEAEKTWRQALKAATEVARIYAEATQQLESTLVMESKKAEVRPLLADVLFERALLAERDHRSGEQDDLVKRFRVFDSDDQRWTKWTSTAEVTLDVTPAGATFIVERYIKDPKGRYHLEKVPDLPDNQRIKLEPGSYRFTFTLDGYATVHYPLLLSRDEKFKLSLALPVASSVPSGFAYVPAGRFLFGSARGEDVRRQWLRAAPIHEVSTKAFLIAKLETTFADWIEFLSSLPGKTRAQFTSQFARNNGFTGSLNLSETPAGWKLTLQPPKQNPYSALRGDKITYQGRDANTVVDWLKLPSTGMSHVEANVYVKWLSDTKRVPGARLCTEIEWERAARGADAREYPHGDQLIPTDANYGETYMPNGSAPDEVGSHPQSTSPFDVLDMTGNAWEWTALGAGMQDPTLRGGSYVLDEISGLTTNREAWEPTMRDATVGMRVCRDPS